MSLITVQEDSVLNCRIKEWTHTQTLLELFSLELFSLEQELGLRDFRGRDVPLLTHRLPLAWGLCVRGLSPSVGGKLPKGGRGLYIGGSRGIVSSDLLSLRKSGGTHALVQLNRTRGAKDRFRLSLALRDKPVLVQK